MIKVNSKVMVKDLMEIKDVFDKLDTQKRIDIFIEANSKTVDKILKHIPERKTSVPDILIMMSGYKVNKNEIYPNNCVRIGRILYFLDTGKSFNLGKSFEESMKEINI